MRVPISWLRDYVDIHQTPAQLAEILTNAGLEVTTTEFVGVEGADLVWDRDKVFLAHLLKVERHPDADKLVLATVDYGRDEPKVVVTGAPNLYPYLERGDVADLGLMSPLLVAGGTYLDPYRGNKPTRLKGKKLRGIFNDAMLCSPLELGLGEEHEGILLLPQDGTLTRQAPGTPLQDVLGDTVLDIDVIPNVARCASVLGVAREVAALTGEALRLPPGDVVMEGEPVAGRVRITTEEPELNPRFVALLIEGVGQEPAPFWMQHRLRLAGQRPINVVVDISNYVMLEIGQPNHTFDYDLLRRRADEYAPDGPIHVVTRLAAPGEKLVTLDGAERRLYPNNILVTDPKGSLSLGGIIGGLESEIQPDTRNVLLEAAAWDFINIRRTTRQLAVNTEAGFRFGRGVHPTQAMVGARRAAELLRTLAGGTVAQGIVDYYPQPAETVRVSLTPEYVRRLSGVDLGRQEVAALLERLAFEVEDEGEHLAVTAPDHRLDIEGPHDLVEEVCRMYGYQNVPSTVLQDVLPPQRGNPALEREEAIKDALVGQGLQEVITYRLTTPEAEAKVRADSASIDDNGTGSYVRLKKPSTNDRVVMRHSLLASVLEVVAANTRFQDSINLFEVGSVYPRTDGEALPKESSQLVIVMTGLRDEPYWELDGTPRLDFYDLKGVVESLARELKLTLGYTAANRPGFRPGHTAGLALDDGSEVGTLGEIHPLVVEAYDMRVETEQPVLAAVVDLETLLPRIPKAAQIEPVPAYPAVREDLALVVDEDVAAASVQEALRSAGAPLLRQVELFDVYTGEKVGAGKKSLAYHLTFQSPSKTLQDRDTQRMRNKILKQLEARLGATLRQ